ncbi:MAG: recombinase family protein [Lachnospiraceae bacterium]|nr:recombinase family protein [Lachnospiraceae bacterium]
MSKKRVRTLLRVSSKQQLHDDDIPVQRAEAEAYIAMRPDWEFDSEYIEKAVSAYKNGVQDREVLQQILEDARNREFDVLLTYMSDRIGRQEEYSTYVATLNSLGIEVWTIKDGQLKTEEHIDKLLNYIRFWQNAGESEKTSKRVRDTQRELIKSGKFLGGKAPYGYELIPSGEISNHGRLLKKPVIVEEHAAIVRKIYNLAVYQGYGYEKIAKTLNAESIPPVEAAKWRACTIASILKNPIYMGYPCIGRRVNHGSFTRLDRRDWIYSEEQVQELIIIQPELWEKAQEIREARKAKINTSKEKSSKQYEEQYNVPFSTKGKLALIGLVHCGYCGKRLKNGSYANHWTTKAGEKKVSFTGRYTCPEKCRERSCYSQSYLEDIVFNVVESYMERLKNIDVSEEIEKMYSEQNKNTEKELQKIQKEQKKLQQDIETLEEKIPEAIRGEYYFSAEKLSSIIKEKQQALSELDETIKEIKKTLADNKLQRSDMEEFICRVPNWKEEFQNADVQTKQMLLSTIIDKIEVKDGDIRIKFKIRLDDYTDGVAMENLVLKSNDSPTIPYRLCLA